MIKFVNEILFEIYKADFYFVDVEGNYYEFR